jgi:hypothetical protein
VQVLNCNYGVSCQSPVFWVRNGLFNNVQTVFSTSSSGVVGNGEHLIVDSASYLNGSSSLLTLNVTNSLLVSVTTPGTYSGAGNATDTSAALQSALAGTHYLANGSLHHNAGTGNISYQLQTDFRNFTTYPPLVYLNVTNSVNSLWAPQAARDTSGTPDRGYHYPALDYLISGVIVNGGTLVLTNGVAVAGYGSYALRTSGSGVVVSEGIPEQMNRLTTYHAVQEQGQRWITNFWMLNGVNLNLRFTDATAMSGANSLVASGELGAGTLNFRDCQFHDVAWTLYKYSSTVTCVNFTNNVFDRCAWSFAQGYYPYVQSPYPLSLQLHNNLFSHTSLTLYHYSSYYGTWELYDNLFDGAKVSLTEESGNPSYYLTTFGYNGFIGTVNALLAATDKRNLTRDFVSGPLGPYYYPATGGTGSLATLVNADTSRTPASLGLYHDTTRIDQSKEAGTALDIGFHYVAATPAESEIAKAGTTATASSTAYGWVPSYGIDSLTSDPGWHNASYTENPAYLRIDLGSSQTVDRVGYVPRVMSASWTDGSWNGVFRKFNVYVTDDASGNAANWGAPVASGEWFWPNRQERKDVSFAPAVGRYVILQRVSAWGWYGPQDANWANYGYPPGYASADEVWVYRHQWDMVHALDSDADGIADYEEDANGNGVVDSGETDPSNPFSLESCRFDGEVKAGSTEVFLYDYTLRANRDLTDSPRSANYPDGTFSMGWGANWASEMHMTNDFTECRVPPPPLDPNDTMREGQDYYWPPSGPGYFTSWTVLAGGNNPPPGLGLNIPRPPSLVLNIPWEKCWINGSDFIYQFDNTVSPFLSGTYRRNAQTTIRLDTGGWQWPKPARSVVLSCTAFNRSSGSTISINTEGYLAEPDDEIGQPPQPVDPVTTPIFIRNQQLNADGTTMLQVARGTSITDVTPSTGVDWYQFDVSASLPNIVHMTWSRHPLLRQAADVQRLFDDGAMLLAKDDDALVRDDDPRVKLGDPEFDRNLYDSDDVPLYVEFIAMPARNSTFPQNYANTNWTINAYYDITDYNNARQLLYASFANVKQVHYMGWWNDDYTKFLVVAGVTLSSMAPTMVILANATTPVPVHEWGHTVGLPDNTNDTDRVMYQDELVGTHKKINREERTNIVWSVWSGTPWGW